MVICEIATPRRDEPRLVRGCGTCGTCGANKSENRLQINSDQVVAELLDGITNSINSIRRFNKSLIANRKAAQTICAIRANSDSLSLKVIHERIGILRRNVDSACEPADDFRGETV